MKFLVRETHTAIQNYLLSCRPHGKYFLVECEEAECWNEDVTTIV